LSSSPPPPSRRYPLSLSFSEARARLSFSTSSNVVVVVAQKCVSSQQLGFRIFLFRIPSRFSGEKRCSQSPTTLLPLSLSFYLLHFFFLLKKKSKRSPFHFDDLTFFYFCPSGRQTAPNWISLSYDDRDESEGESHVFKKKNSRHLSFRVVWYLLLKRNRHF
jgi:hypothetical protein